MEKILCFSAVCAEEAIGTQQEKKEEVAQRVKIYYYLEDDTLRVVQTPSPNAGGVQGTLVGRQRVAIESSPLSQHLTLHSLKVGECVKVLGRQYLVTSCDTATRTYLTSLGLCPRPDLLPHPSPSLQQQEAVPELTRAAKLQFHGDWPKTYPLATFVRHSGQVLRFYGEWVDETRGSEVVGGVTSGVTERVEVRYYLEDDTGEVRVHHLTPHQDALTPTPPTRPTKLLRRGPIPKDVSETLGASSLGAYNRPTLNLLGLRGGRVHLKDRCPQAECRPAVLGPLDLVLGREVRVCGRLLRLCECDAFTRTYYKNVLDIDQVPAEYQYLHRKIRLPPSERCDGPLDPRWLDEHPRDPLHPLPTTVTTLVGGNHARDIRGGCEGIILRFGAKLITDVEKDKDREFVVNFYVFDSTISVFEVPRINSGLRAGMFLSRGLVVRGKGRGHVGAQDLYVGASPTLNSHAFILMSADEFTLDYMERHADQANYNVALDAARRRLDHHQLSDLLKRLTTNDPRKTGLVSTSVATSALLVALGRSELSPQQVSALTRRHRHLQATPLTREQLAHLAALHLKRHNFNGVDELRAGLRARDKEGSGRLRTQCVRAALLATRLPLLPPLTDALIRSAREEDGQVKYEDLCRDLDWRLRPHIHNLPPCQLDERSLCEGLRRVEDLTDYLNLVADLEGSAATHHLAGSGLV